MSAPPSVSNIQELVMEMCSILFYTGKMLTGDRLYSAISSAKMHHEKNLSYCGTINKNKKSLRRD